MRVATSVATALLLAVGCTTAFSQEKESPLAAFAGYIGQWTFPDAFLAENPWAHAVLPQTYEWGPRHNIVRLREHVYPEDPDRLVFEGFAFWHPSEDKVKFVGYNMKKRFFFEGEYVVLEPDRLVREYTVHYPPGFEHSVFKQLEGATRLYRGERRLTDKDTLELTTFIRVDGAWVQWSSKPFVIKRVQPAQ